jgi:hypothetical protein
MKTKLEQFIKRNKKRNEHLYQDKLQLGYDYVVCPISGERLSMIKDNYIVNVLAMCINDYPIVQRECQKRKENIKKGLQQIDADTGLTKYELGQEKARHVLRQVDETGMSGYAKKGQKTRGTHLSRVDELGRNGYRRQADYRLTTVLPNGLTIEQHAHIKQKEKLIANNVSGSGGASKLSKKILKPILEFLDDNAIHYYFDLTEYGIKDIDTGNYYFYDLTIPELAMVIEYQSSAWHADPGLSENEWRDWKPPRGKGRTAIDVLQYDYNKARSLYKNRGMVTYYVWQRTQDTDIMEILCLLKTLITKS